MNCTVPSHFALLYLAATLHQAASNVGAYLINPIGLGWYHNIDLAPLLWKDHIHLNNAGQEYYANRLVDNLKQWFTPWHWGDTMKDTTAPSN